MASITVRRRFRGARSFSVQPKRRGSVRTGSAKAYDPHKEQQKRETRARRFESQRTQYLTRQRREEAGKERQSRTQMQERSLTAAKQRQAAEHRRAATTSTLEVLKGAKGPVSQEQAEKLRQWQIGGAAGAPAGRAPVAGARRRMGGARRPFVRKAKPRTKARILTGGTIGYVGAGGRSVTMPAVPAAQTQQERQSYIDMIGQARQQGNVRAAESRRRHVEEMQAQREQITSRPLWQHDLKLRNDVARIDRDLAQYQQMEQAGGAGLRQTDVRNIREIAERPLLGGGEFQGMPTYQASEAYRQQFPQDQRQAIDQWGNIPSAEHQRLTAQLPPYQPPAQPQPMIAPTPGLSPQERADEVEGAMMARGASPAEIAQARQQILQQAVQQPPQQPPQQAPVQGAPPMPPAAPGPAGSYGYAGDQMPIMQNVGGSRAWTPGVTPGTPDPLDTMRLTQEERRGMPQEVNQYQALRRRAGNIQQGPAQLQVPAMEQGVMETAYAPSVLGGLPPGQREEAHRRFMAARQMAQFQASGVPAPMIQQDITAQYGPEVAQRMMATETPAPGPGAAPAGPQAPGAQPPTGAGFWPEQRVPAADRATGAVEHREEVLRYSKRLEPLIWAYGRQGGGYNWQHMQAIQQQLATIPDPRIRREVAQNILNTVAGDPNLLPAFQQALAAYLQ